MLPVRPKRASERARESGRIVNTGMRTMESNKFKHHHYLTWECNFVRLQNSLRFRIFDGGLPKMQILLWPNTNRQIWYQRGRLGSYPLDTYTHTVLLCSIVSGWRVGSTATPMPMYISWAREGVKGLEKGLRRHQRSPCSQKINKCMRTQACWNINYTYY